MADIRIERLRQRERRRDLDATSPAALARPGTWVSADDGGGRGDLVQLQPGHIAGADVASAFDGWDGALEHTSGRDRAVGLILRSLPLLALQFLLSIGLVGLAALTVWSSASLGPSVILILVLWGLMASGTYLWLDRSERADSRVGLEKHRINAAVGLEFHRVDLDYDLKRRAVDAYIRSIESQNEQRQLRG